MKTIKINPRRLFALGLMTAVAVILPLSVHAKEEKVADTGSIRPTGTVKPADLPAMAKVSFESALKAALAASPGKIIKAELEIEDGNLMYSFEIVGSHRSITEVEIDAGNGKVLGIDHEEAEKPESGGKK